MTETHLKDIFRETLGGEPSVQVPADEDIARGRARKQRIRRNRAAGGVALLAVAGLGAAVLPAVFDDGDSSITADGGDGGSGSYPPEVGDDPIKQQLWDAIESALPADVEAFVSDDPAFAATPEVGPSIGVLLERGDNGLGFSFGVSVEKSRPELPEYRPCTEPGLLEGTWSQWQNCEEGRDDDGVWRAAGDLGDFGTSVLLAENDDVSVNVHWGTQPRPLPGSESESSDLYGDDAAVTSMPTGPTLTRPEGEAVRDAVLTAASDLDPDDLTSGLELSAVADAWPEVRSILEDAAGAALTPIGGDEPVVDLQDPEYQVGTVSAEYVTADGLEVEIWFWQRPRVSEPMCLEAIMQCASVTGGQELLGPPEEGGSGGEGGTSIGQRGDTWIRAQATDPSDERPGTVTAVTLQPLSDLLNGLLRSPFESGD